MTPFDWSTVFVPIVAFLSALRAPVAGLLLAAGGCLGTGCGPTAWNAKHVNTEMGTQFEIGYVSESKIIIGFPGKVTAKGNASGEYVPAPKSSGPISMKWTDPATSDLVIDPPNKFHDHGPLLVMVRDEPQLESWTDVRPIYIETPSPEPTTTPMPVNAK